MSVFSCETSLKGCGCVLSSGKLTTAPCGHEGEHVIGQYVRCLRGCDSAKKPAVEQSPIVPPGYDEAEWFTDIVLKVFREDFFDGIMDHSRQFECRTHAHRAYLYGQARRYDLSARNGYWILKHTEKNVGFLFIYTGVGFTEKTLCCAQ